MDSRSLLTIHSILTNLCHNSRVRRNSQSRRGTSERLSASLHINQVQARAQTLVINQVSEEIQQITRERSGGGASDEAVHGHIAVGSLVQAEADAADGGGRDGRASRRNGARAAQRRKPDHDLVLVGAGGGGRQEHVVGNVGHDVGGGVAGLVSMCHGVVGRTRGTYLHFQVDLMLLIALSCLAVNCRAALAKLLTFELAPAQDQVVDQDRVVPLSEFTVVHCWPLVA